MKYKQGVWYKGKHRPFQDMSIEEQEDFWKDIEAMGEGPNIDALKVGFFARIFQKRCTKMYNLKKLII